MLLDGENKIEENSFLFSTLLHIAINFVLTFSAICA
jgi:hypothetical protein